MNSAIEINVGIMCSCLSVLKPMIKEYGGKLLGSFFINSSDQQSATKLSGKDRWNKQASYQLGSMDKGGVIVGTHEPRRMNNSSEEDIIVTSSFTVEDAHPGNARGNKNREFDTESQEDILKRVKKYSR